MNHNIFIYGMRFPNRLFVGGLPKTVQAKGLADFFESYGVVVEAKIIMSNSGVSKGYGFVTFESHEDVKAVMAAGQQGLYIQGRKLNLGPAVRKQAPDAPGESVVVVQHGSQAAQQTQEVPVTVTSETPPSTIPATVTSLPVSNATMMTSLDQQMQQLNMQQQYIQAPPPLPVYSQQGAPTFYYASHFPTPVPMPAAHCPNNFIDPRH